MRWLLYIGLSLSIVALTSSGTIQRRTYNGKDKIQRGTFIEPKNVASNLNPADESGKQVTTRKFTRRRNIDDADKLRNNLEDNTYKRSRSEIRNHENDRIKQPSSNVTEKTNRNRMINRGRYKFNSAEVTKSQKNDLNVTSSNNTIRNIFNATESPLFKRTSRRVIVKKVVKKSQNESHTDTINATSTIKPIEITTHAAIDAQQHTRKIRLKTLSQKANTNSPGEIIYSESTSNDYSSRKFINQVDDKPFSRRPNRIYSSTFNRRYKSKAASHGDVTKEDTDINEDDNYPESFKATILGTKENIQQNLNTSEKKKEPMVTYPEKEIRNLTRFRKRIASPTTKMPTTSTKEENNKYNTNIFDRPLKNPVYSKLMKPKSTESVGNSMSEIINEGNVETLSGIANKKFHANYKDFITQKSRDFNDSQSTESIIKNIQRSHYLRSKALETSKPRKVESSKQYSRQHLKSSKPITNGIQEQVKPARIFSSRYRAPLEKILYPSTQMPVSSATTPDDEGDLETGQTLISYTNSWINTPTAYDLKLSETRLTPMIDVETSNYSPSVTISIFEALAEILTSTPKSTNTQYSLNIVSPHKKEKDVRKLSAAQEKDVEVSKSNKIQTIHSTVTSFNPRTPLATITLYSTTEKPTDQSMTSLPTTTIQPQSSDLSSTVHNNISDIMQTKQFSNISIQVINTLSNNLKQELMNVDENLRENITLSMDNILNSIVKKSSDNLQFKEEISSGEIQTTPLSVDQINDSFKYDEFNFTQINTSLVNTTVEDITSLDQLLSKDATISYKLTTSAPPNLIDDPMDTTNTSQNGKSSLNLLTSNSSSEKVLISQAHLWGLSRKAKVLKLIEDIIKEHNKELNTTPKYTFPEEINMFQTNISDNFLNRFNSISPMSKLLSKAEDILNDNNTLDMLKDLGYKSTMTFTDVTHDDMTTTTIVSTSPILEVSGVDDARETPFTEIIPTFSENIEESTTFSAEEDDFNENNLEEDSTEMSTLLPEDLTFRNINIVVPDKNKAYDVAWVPTTEYPTTKPSNETTVHKTGIINKPFEAASQTTIPKKDYVIFGILPNNTVVRKNPNENILETLTESSPYIIYGVLPNNTLIRRFPNGTRVPRVMQNIDVLPISPWSLRNPYSPIHNNPAIVKPSTFNTFRYNNTDTAINTSTESPGDNVNSTVMKSQTIKINENQSDSISKPNNTPQRHVISLRTKTILPPVSDILINSISSATKEENKFISSSSTEEPRILTLDIDPETKQIRTESPLEGAGAYFKFIPIKDVRINEKGTNVFKISTKVKELTTVSDNQYTTPGLSTSLKAEQKTTPLSTSIMMLPSQNTITTQQDTFVVTTTTENLITTTTIASTPPTTEISFTISPATTMETTVQPTTITTATPATTINISTEVPTTPSTTTTQSTTTTTSTSTSPKTTITTKSTTITPITTTSPSPITTTSSITQPSTTTTPSTTTIPGTITTPSTIKSPVTSTIPSTTTNPSTTTIPSTTTTTSTTTIPSTTIMTSTTLSPSTTITTSTTTTASTLTPSNTKTMEDSATSTPTTRNPSTITSTFYTIFPRGRTTTLRSISSTRTQTNSLILVDQKATDEPSGRRIPSQKFSTTTDLPLSSTYTIDEDIAFLNNLKSVVGTDTSDPENDLANRIIALAVERSLVDLQVAKQSTTMLPTLWSISTLISTPSTKTTTLSTTTTTSSTTTETPSTTTTTTSTTTTKPILSTPSIEEDLRQFQKDTALLQMLLKATGQNPSNIKIPTITSPKASVPPKTNISPDNLDIDLKLLQNLLASPSPLNEPFDSLTAQSKPSNVDSSGKIPTSNIKPLKATIRSTTQRPTTIRNLNYITKPTKDETKKLQEDTKILQTLIDLQEKSKKSTKTNQKGSYSEITSGETLKRILVQTERAVPATFTKTPIKLSTEYGKTNDALLAALLKEQGLGPTTVKSIEDRLRLSALLNQVAITPKYKSTTTTPKPQRRPILDGLAWLWQQWQETAPGPGPTRAFRRPQSSRETTTRATNWFGSGPFIGNADESENRVPLESSSDVEEIQTPARGQLVSAAINVTRAFSQFLGAAIQGAAQTVQNVIKAGQKAANTIYTSGSKSV